MAQCSLVSSSLTPAGGIQKEMDTSADLVSAESVNELRLRALRGELSTILLASIDRLKHAVVPSCKLAVFASSTFTDTVRERNVLLEKILPDLRERGRLIDRKHV